MNPTIKAACLFAASELVPACNRRDDDGWGGIDEKSLAARREKAAKVIENCLDSHITELELYRAMFSRAVDACGFLHDEGETLGLHLGQDIIADGVPALRAQRDALRAENERLQGVIRRLQQTLEKSRPVVAEDDPDVCLITKSAG